jgi:hypothetical protein
MERRWGRGVSTGSWEILLGTIGFGFYSDGTEKEREEKSTKSVREDDG